MRGEKSENKRREEASERGGRRGVKGEGAGETALTGGAVGGLSRARTCGCGSPEEDKCAGGSGAGEAGSTSASGSEIKEGRKEGVRGEATEVEPGRPDVQQPEHEAVRLR